MPPVGHLSVDNGVIYAGGDFTSAGGGSGTTERNRLAAFDTAGNLLDWSQLVGRIGQVRSLIVDNGVIYAGGSFASAVGGTGAKTRMCLAAVDPDGELLTK